VNEILLDSGETGNDDMQVAASVFPSDSQNVDSSIVKHEHSVDKSTDNIGRCSEAVEENCVREKESSPKHSETSCISAAQCSAEVKTDGAKQPAV